MKTLEQKVYEFSCNGNLNPKETIVFKDEKRITKEDGLILTLSDLFFGKYLVEGKLLIGYSPLETLKIIDGDFNLDGSSISLRDGVNSVMIVNVRNRFIQMNDVTMTPLLIKNFDLLKSSKKEFKQVEILLKNDYKISKEKDFIFGYKQDNESYLFQEVDGKLWSIDVESQESNNEDIVKEYSLSGGRTLYYAIERNEFSIS